MVVDDINGSLHQTLDARPEAAYLMDTDGTVAFRTLPPLGRSLAAITIAMAGMLVLITSVRRLLATEGVTYIFSIAASSLALTVLFRLWRHFIYARVFGPAP